MSLNTPSIWLANQHDADWWFSEQWQSARDKRIVGPYQDVPMWLTRETYTKLNRFCANIATGLRYQRVEILLGPPRPGQSRSGGGPVFEKPARLVAGAYRNSDDQTGTRYLSKVDDWTRGLRRVLETGEEWRSVQKRLQAYLKSEATAGEMERGALTEAINSYVDYRFVATTVAVVAGLADIRQNHEAGCIHHHFATLASEGTLGGRTHRQLVNFLEKAQKSTGSMLQAAFRSVIAANKNHPLLKLPIEPTLRSSILDDARIRIEREGGKKEGLETAFDVLELLSGTLEPVGDGPSLIREALVKTLDTLPTTVVMQLFHAPVAEYPRWLDSGTGSASVNGRPLLYPDLRAIARADIRSTQKHINPLSLMAYEIAATEGTRDVFLPDPSCGNARHLRSMLVIPVRYDSEDDDATWSGIVRLMNRYDPQGPLATTGSLHLYRDASMRVLGPDAAGTELPQHDEYADERGVMASLQKVVSGILQERMSFSVHQLEGRAPGWGTVKGSSSTQFGYELPQLVDEYPWPLSVHIRKTVSEALGALREDGIIVLYGPDGSGKNTVVEYVARRLLSHEKDAGLLRKLNSALLSVDPQKELKAAVKTMRQHGGVLHVLEPAQLPPVAQAELYKFLVDAQGPPTSKPAWLRDRHQGYLVVTSRTDLGRLTHDGKLRPDLFRWLDARRSFLLPRLQAWPPPDVIEVLRAQCRDPASGLTLELPGQLAAEVYDALDDFDWPSNLYSLKSLAERLREKATRGTLGEPTNGPSGTCFIVRDQDILDALNEVAAMTGLDDRRERRPAVQPTESETTP